MTEWPSERRPFTKFRTSDNRKDEWSSLDGRPVVRFPRIWMSYGKCLVNEERLETNSVEDVRVHGIAFVEVAMMRPATVVAIDFARWSVTILLAAFLGFAASAASAQKSAKPTARSDVHLDGLSQTDLKRLLNQLKRVDRFGQDKIVCNKAFLRARESGGEKLNAGKKLATSEQTAIDAQYPGDVRSWIHNFCMRLRGWKKPKAAGSTDHYGGVEIPQEKKSPKAKKPVSSRGKISGIEAAWAKEDYRITEVHEAVHVRDHKKVAKGSALDFDKVRKWGKLRKKIKKFLDNYPTNISPAHLAHALFDLKSYQDKYPQKPFSSDGRGAAEEARKTLSQAEIDGLIWRHKNRKNLEIYTNYVDHPVIVAKSEIRAYQVEVPFVQTRIAAITARIAAGAIGPVPSGAYKDSGDGASQNNRIVFRCEMKSARGGLPCTATYAGTGDGKSARIVGSFDHKTATLEGFWIESKSNQKCKKIEYGSYYWGRILFVFNRNAKFWKGKWNYCGGPVKYTWNGTK